MTALKRTFSSSHNPTKPHSRKKFSKKSSFSPDGKNSFSSKKTSNPNPQNKLGRNFKCRYCSHVSTCCLISRHEPRCPLRFKHSNLVQQETAEHRVAKLRELKYQKVKKEIHKRGLKMGTKIGLKCWDGSVSEVELGAIAQQSVTIRHMLNRSQLGSVFEIPCGPFNRSIVISFCVNFNHNFNMRVHFPNRNWWNEMVNFHPWSLAVVSKFMEIEPLLTFCVDAIAQEMLNTLTFEELKRRCGFAYDLDSDAELAVHSILLDRYIDYQRSEAYLQRLEAIIYHN